jgi:hypothetical protein
MLCFMQTHYLHELTIHNASLAEKGSLGLINHFRVTRKGKVENGGHLEVHLVDAQGLQWSMYRDIVA